MNFAELEANPVDLRTGNDDVLNVNEYSDEDLKNLCYESSKTDLKMDLQAELSLTPDDTANLDNYANLFTERLQKALAYKQLIYFYISRNSASDSQSDIRMKLYQSYYNTIKSTFSMFASNIVNNTTVCILRR
jgi:hypothetical protein